MFGLSVVIEKGAALAAIGISGAICACFMLKNGIERLINGTVTAHDTRPRLKGLILTLVSMLLLTGSILIIFESDALADHVGKTIKNFKEAKATAQAEAEKESQ